jgi:hypothetical protein
MLTANELAKALDTLLEERRVYREALLDINVAHRINYDANEKTKSKALLEINIIIDDLFERGYFAE